MFKNEYIKENPLPKHCLKGFPENPGAHWQLNPPGVLVQRALAPHLPVGPWTLSHSSTSIKKEISRYFYTFHAKKNLFFIFFFCKISMNTNRRSQLRYRSDWKSILLHKYNKLHVRLVYKMHEVHRSLLDMVL